ncbi:MAG: reverse transcriptase domain-containing protein, partial [Eggerthellaceae bacterium]|nr:reverse transcriptase domain-containing protein [Eggerthellaceae bacterium]
MREGKCKLACTCGGAKRRQQLSLAGGKAAFSPVAVNGFQRAFSFPLGQLRLDMSIIEELDNEASWTSFLAYKKEKGHLLARDEESLVSLIASKGYLPVVRSIREGVALAPPEKLLINKMGTAKKRTVYCFESDVMWVLKHLAWLLYRFDDKQPEGCYSFRRNFGAHRAFKDIIKTRGINAHWCCKLDISDYFNSIDVALMLPILEQALADDAALYGFFEQFLCADAAFFNGELIAEKRGVMAGTPTAPFLANLYLGELDRLFVGRGLPYARYSDDIIVFAQSQAEVLSCREDAIRIIEGNGLR